MGQKQLFLMKKLVNFNKNVNFVKVSDARVELARLLNWFYHRRNKPKIIAVTGTNGKTSVTMYTFNATKKIKYQLFVNRD